MNSNKLRKVQSQGICSRQSCLHLLTHTRFFYRTLILPARCDNRQNTSHRIQQNMHPDFPGTVSGASMKQMPAVARFKKQAITLKRHIRNDKNTLEVQSLMVLPQSCAAMRNDMAIPYPNFTGNDVEKKQCIQAEPQFWSSRCSHLYQSKNDCEIL